MLKTWGNAEDFFARPSFIISSFKSLLENNRPPLITELLEKYVFNEYGILISEQKDSAVRNLNALQRYNNFHKYKYLSNEYPLLLLILSESCFWLDDLYTSVKLLNELLVLLDKDVQLSYIIELISQYILINEKIDEEYFNNEGDDAIEGILYKWEHPFFPFECKDFPVDSYSLNGVIDKWTALKNEIDKNEIIEEFRRYACLATNDLEGVFEVNGKSWTRLIKRGFFIDSIDETTKKSKIKNKDSIIRILTNTSLCLDLLSEILDNPNNFNENFIKRLHSILMKDNEIESFEYEDDNNRFFMYKLLRTGSFRRLSCRTTHTSVDGNDEIIQFCHASNIVEEMSDFCNKTRLLLNDANIDPFVKSAWIQWAFLRIHCFEDGNGRVGRIISSIPLLKLNLPPIVITTKIKDEYFSCIHDADRKYDITSLSNFIIKSYYVAMEDISDINNIESKNIKSGKTNSRK